MAAYILVDVQVSDPERYQRYMALTPAAIAAAGGEFVVRGGRHQVLEGTWQPGRIVVLRFPDYDTARAFYDSAGYRTARAEREGATERFNMVLVDGL